MMRTSARPFATLAILLVAAACSHHMDLRKTASQDNFGVQMARMNLWREALFRFERAVEINPSDAMAHNNLAVAWEANGDFEKARKEYLEALRLDRTNQYIQKNYSRYVEFLSRNRKRQQTKTASAAPAATTPAPSTEPKATTNVGGLPPGVPVATEPVKPPPTVTPPSDLPPQPNAPAQPATPPQPKPPGGGR